jgi:hypothetical protein
MDNERDYVCRHPHCNSLGDVSRRQQEYPRLLPFRSDTDKYSRSAWRLIIKNRADNDTRLGNLLKRGRGRDLALRCGALLGWYSHLLDLRGLVFPHQAIKKPIEREPSLHPQQGKETQDTQEDVDYRPNVQLVIFEIIIHGSFP